MTFWWLSPVDMDRVGNACTAELRRPKRRIGEAGSAEGYGVDASQRIEPKVMGGGDCESCDHGPLWMGKRPDHAVRKIRIAQRRGVLTSRIAGDSTLSGFNRAWSTRVAWFPWALEFAAGRVASQVPKLRLCTILRGREGRPFPAFQVGDHGAWACDGKGCR